MNSHETGQYGPSSDLVDYILGITFEIWEQGQVDLIRRYYSDDCLIHALDATTIGAEAVVEGTLATLKAFPDRLLLADNVVWSGTNAAGFYSSHRLTSPMTNLGDSLFGPATGKAVRVTNIADCIVEQGVITSEWLVRDNLALVQQLGIAPGVAAKQLASRMPEDHQAWLRAEAERSLDGARGDAGTSESCDATQLALVHDWLTTVWHTPSSDVTSIYSPYATLYRAPTRVFAGAERIAQHYRQWHEQLSDIQVRADHVIAQPIASNGTDLAVRWCGGARDAGTGASVYLLGVSHLRCYAGRIAAEWTVMDDLAVFAQSKYLA